MELSYSRQQYVLAIRLMPNLQAAFRRAEDGRNEVLDIRSANVRVSV